MVDGPKIQRRAAMEAMPDKSSRERRDDILYGSLFIVLALGNLVLGGYTEYSWEIMGPLWILGGIYFIVQGMRGRSKP